MVLGKHYIEVLYLKKRKKGLFFFFFQASEAKNRKGLWSVMRAAYWIPTHCWCGVCSNNSSGGYFDTHCPMVAELVHCERMVIDWLTFGGKKMSTELMIQCFLTPHLPLWNVLTLCYRLGVAAKSKGSVWLWSLWGCWNCTLWIQLE